MPEPKNIPFVTGIGFYLMVRGFDLDAYFDNAELYVVLYANGIFTLISTVVSDPVGLDPIFDALDDGDSIQGTRIVNIDGIHFMTAAANSISIGRNDLLRSVDLETWSAVLTDLTPAIRLIVVKVNDNKLLAIHTENTNPVSRLVIKTSSDNGDTWSDVYTIQADINDVDEGNFVCADALNDTAIFVFNVNRSPRSEILLVITRDGGSTFTEVYIPIPHQELGDEIGGLWTHFGSEQLRMWPNGAVDIVINTYDAFDWDVLVASANNPIDPGSWGFQSIYSNTLFTFVPAGMQGYARYRDILFLAVSDNTIQESSVETGRFPTKFSYCLNPGEPYVEIESLPEPVAAIYYDPSEDTLWAMLEAATSANIPTLFSMKRPTSIGSLWVDRTEELNIAIDREDSSSFQGMQIWCAGEVGVRYNVNVFKWMPSQSPQNIPRKSNFKCV